MRQFIANRYFLWVIAFGLFTLGQTSAQDSERADPTKSEQPEPTPVVSPMEIPRQLAGLSSEEFRKLVDRCRDSVVVVEFQGRDGKTLGLGSGFVVDESGLIATNLHVIGEARPILVRTLEGDEYEVVSVEGTDKTQDVALLRIDAKSLTPLPMAKPDELKQGEPIFALGNPEGLEHSVVTGIVSGFRTEEDGMSLIQLAIPIERGNSGGPLLDMQGRVHGLLTLKSQVTDNLGYAVRANAVQALMTAPNPIPMSRWLTIGRLNLRKWDADDAVNWRQRAGRIHVSGTGRGFGGRSLCLSKESVPDVPFELAVDVKIEEEDGAAGLVFHSDGGDVHYGFYPSSSQLRLSRFDGPTVYSWNVLEEVRSPSFRPDEWNSLKVRVEEGKIICSCNDQVVITSVDDRLKSGRVGLAKFRHTTAEFKRFRIAKEIPSETPDAETKQQVRELAMVIAPATPPGDELIEQYAGFDRSGMKALKMEAQVLEKRAERLRQLAREIHDVQVRSQIQEALKKSQGPKLLQAALELSHLDNPDLEVDAYLEIVEDMAGDFLATEAKTQELDADENDSDEAQPGSEVDRLKRFHKFFFDENGFHGSRTNYYHASNSYLNEVIDDREGLPITLAVLYVELARRVGFKAEGIGLPGHFIAGVQVGERKTQYVDVFNQGEFMSVKDCRERVREFSGLTWSQSYLKPQTPEEIISRMLRNLIRIANQEEDLEAALRYTRTLLMIEPDSPEDRLYKAVVCYNTERLDEALAEVNWVLELGPPNLALGKVRQLKDAIEEKIASTIRE